MAIRTKQELKDYFKNGDKPDETHFADLIDTLFPAIPVANPPTLTTPYPEIASTSATQTITLTGSNLSNLTSIAIENAQPIDMTNDVNIISDNEIEVTFTAGSNVGNQDVTINGVVIADYLPTDVNDGWQDLDDVSYPTPNIDTYKNHGIANQDTRGVTLSPTGNSATSWERITRFSDFSINDNQVLDVIYSFRTTSNNDIIQVGLLDINEDLANATNGFSITQLTSPKFDILQKRGDNVVGIGAVENNNKRYGFQKSHPFNTSSYIWVRCEISATHFSFYLLNPQNADDKIGELMYKLPLPEAGWSGQKCPTFSVAYQNRTSIYVKSIRIR